MSGLDNESREEYQKRMIMEGKTVHMPSGNELFLDLDNHAHVDAFINSWAIFAREMMIRHDEDIEDLVKLTITRSSSKAPHHWHIRIAFAAFTEEFDDISRIAMQGALGSDPTRELLSMLRAMNGDEFPTLLVESANWDAETFTLPAFITASFQDSGLVK